MKEASGVRYECGNRDILLDMVESGRVEAVEMLCGQVRNVRGNRLQIVRVVDCIEIFVLVG